VEAKTCRVCLETKILDKYTWLVQNGKFVGKVCRACENIARLARQKTRRETDEEYRLAQNKANLTNITKRLAEDEEFRKRQRETSLACNKRRRIRDPEYAASMSQRNCIRQKTRRETNEEYRLAQNAKARQYQINNPDKTRAKVMRYKAQKLNRTPKWLTKEDFIIIQEYYTKAAKLTDSTGVVHQVDHIIPLKGKLVSGLHVPSNLQVLTLAENKVKSNTYVID